MLAILVVFYCFSTYFKNKPNPYFQFLESRDTASTNCDCPDTRSLFDIVWSCFSTIFLCTWVSVLPNLPPPGESFLRTAFRRLKIMLYTFVAPELTLTWAMNQWFGARKVATAFNSRGWTKTHGFFLQMGGFHLHRNEESLGVLSFDLLSELVASDEIEFPTITASDIEDRSKGDFVTKGIVIFQTSWFIIQCIARGVQGLALTELELLTVALASLNAVMYFFWWSKPLDVQEYVPVYLKASTSFMHKPELKRAVGSSEARFERELNRINHTKSVRSNFDSWGEYLPSPFRKVTSSLFRKLSAFLEHLREEWETRNHFTFIIIWLVFVPLILPAIPIMEIVGEFGGLEPGAHRVPTFYSIPSTNQQDVIVGLVFALFGVMFGGIHMIGWGFAFPSHTARTLWRVSALSVTCIPFIVTIVEILIPAKGDEEVETEAHSTSWWSKLTYYLIFSLSLLMTILLALYVPARFILFIEALILLKDQPSNAYIEVQWTRFIPHFR
ncbi:hypothetical protein CPB83DRAFT_763563 [Crepidotus variabilis]|uniref:Uncharacterized protein n=1 Tax=Crepidotus variabilis TaxID=179855 RepID=A0A9P6EJZ1_9AGAR|nr:hypothetical protein CPB83DRAFT_763563 [Crepidotus variabilis]